MENAVENLCPPLTLPEIESIVKEPNLLLRNLKVTDGYYRLSSQLFEILGNNNINWCTIATWASKTAGYSIRNEVFPKKINELLNLSDSYRDTITKIDEQIEKGFEAENYNDNSLIDYMNDVFLDVSKLISEGNTMVFEEITPILVDFIETLVPTSDFDDDKLNELLAKYPDGPVEQGGKDYLKKMVRAYYKALFLPESKEKAELILLGTCYIGLHEQIRLQPKIIGSMETPIEKLFEFKFAESMTSQQSGVVDKIIYWFLSKVESV